MPRVAAGRDETMAEKGYVRVRIVATLVGVTMSAVSRWPMKHEIPYVLGSKMCWMDWATTRKHINAKHSQDNVGLADVLGLPPTASQALKLARQMLKLKKVA